MRRGAVWVGGVSVLSLVAGCSLGGRERAPVSLDGRFDEWSDAAPILDDSADAPGATIDLGSLMGLDEPAWLYLSLELGREVSAQSLPGTLELLLDTDADAATGGTLRDMPGVDLALDISQTAEPLVPGRGSGFSLHAVEADGAKGPVVRYGLGVAAAPSWAASRHELRISRRGAVGLPSLGPELRLKAVYHEGGRVVDETVVGSYRFVTGSGDPAPLSATERLVKPAGTLRVAQWNVASESFVQNDEGFARVLAAIEPDVILLDEVPGGITADSVEAFLAREPLGGLGPWRFVMGGSGGRQRTVVAARGREIRPAEAMRSVFHADGALEALHESIPPGFGRALEIEAARGVSSTGAWVEMGGAEVLFVPVDLESQGWAGSPQDLLRTLQARTVNDHVSVARGGATVPVVIAGDLNLVGSRDPLVALGRGLDIDGSDLSPVDAQRLGERTYATWRDPRGLFAPGRLDYMLVPDAAVSVENSFVFTTEDLDPLTLTRLGLEAGLSLDVSDHLVVVADLRIRGPRP